MKLSNKTPIPSTLNALYQLSLSHLMAEWPLNSVFIACNLLYYYQQDNDGTSTKWGSIVVQLGGKDATPTTLKRRETPARKGIRKKEEKRKEKRERRTRSSTTEKCVFQRTFSPWLNQGRSLIKILTFHSILEVVPFFKNH